jgi:hypothetical protein
MLSKTQTETLTKSYKIPTSTEKYYIIALNENSAMPTKKELAMLCSFREFIVRDRGRNAEKILEMDLPTDPSFYTIVFLKGSNWQCNKTRGWCYRRTNWEEGPMYFPSRDTVKPAPPPWTLPRVLNHITNLGGKPSPKWLAWKKEHPKIFR